MSAPTATMPPELALLRIRAVQGGPDDWMRLGQALVGTDAAQEGFDLYRRAAEAGHAAGCIEYGRMLTYGVGCDADARAAAEWFGRAEAKGHPVAGYHLALLAVGDDAVPLDARINERVIAAAKAGFVPALRAAAIHFGRRPDPAEQQLCLHLLNRATGLGDPVAGLLLAARLANGEG
ncbi:MAG TPA: 2OG-Fe(II) oxygenase, partial [Lysobacter sp.]